MSKLSSNAVAALVLSAIAVITSFINVLNWFFWIFTILGIYFAVKVMIAGDKKIAWIAIGVALLSIVTYAIVRNWSAGSSDVVEDESDQDRKEYQQAVDNANYYDVTADPTEAVTKEQKKESIVPEIVEEATEDVEVESSDNSNSEPIAVDDDFVE